MEPVPSTYIFAKRSSASWYAYYIDQAPAVPSMYIFWIFGASFNHENIHRYESNLGRTCTELWRTSLVSNMLSAALYWSISGVFRSSSRMVDHLALLTGRLLTDVTLWSAISEAVAVPSTTACNHLPNLSTDVHVDMGKAKSPESAKRKVTRPTWRPPARLSLCKGRLKTSFLSFFLYLCWPLLTLFYLFKFDIVGSTNELCIVVVLWFMWNISMTSSVRCCWNDWWYEKRRNTFIDTS